MNEHKIVILVSYPFDKKAYRGAVRVIERGIPVTYRCECARKDKRIAENDARKLEMHMGLQNA